jgi:elongator complex protein 3
MDLSININQKKELLRIINQISSIASGDSNGVSKVFNANTYPDLEKLTKPYILHIYKLLKDSGEIRLAPQQEQRFLKNIKTKTSRTMSGVTPVTVMTKPYPCPGKCIYCPDEKNVPKSYIANEPGAQRAISNNFDPFLQTYNRLAAYKNTGHSTDKVELIVIGGTWSFYPKSYQIWFINRCFEALNSFNQTAQDKIKRSIKGMESCTYRELSTTFNKNENSSSRCVGLSIETRPDFINEKEAVHLRKIGVTKVQLGVQSLNPQVLKKICRGHGLKETKKAFKLLRAFGFKIQAHWMPNLPGSSPSKDLVDYKKLFGSPEYRPDEIKIYPCSLIENTPLYRLYENKKWKPYGYKELKLLLKKCLIATPRYCRISRIIRDISSEDIFIGNKRSNLRQEVEKEIKTGQIKEIRYREMRELAVDMKDLMYKAYKYRTTNSIEYFLEMVDENDRLAGFVRLSLPSFKSQLKELRDGAIIREVHVYGQSVPIGEVLKGLPQHSGIGKYLIGKAIEISKQNKFKTVSVISSVGTKPYYRKLGFAGGQLYQHINL